MEPVASWSELQAAVLQAAITIGLAGLCLYLHSRYRKSYFLWWSIAWGIYALRITAIILFLTTGHRHWLFWHQVVTGWTGLTLLWAALVFSQGLRWRWWHLGLALFPPVWSYIAIYRLDDFLLAAGPAVLFLSLATLWTGAAFLTYHRRARSRGAALLAATFFLWGLHHLDYPLLRARGAWNPWGYYLDILFVLAVGAGILLLVLEDVSRGLEALSALSGDLQRAGRDEGVLDRLLERPLSLPGVRGTAMYTTGEPPGFLKGVGACASWTGRPAEGITGTAIHSAIEDGRPVLSDDWAALAGGLRTQGAYAYTAVLPIFRHAAVSGALVIVGETRDPFAALDESFLVALGQQVGAALENADLYRRLQQRAQELERLSLRMLQQHEEQRRRISLELHDETAQVFSAVKLQLGLLRESADPALAQPLDRVLDLIDKGIRSIRSVTNDLRPSLLDDLGLLPAVRALVKDFGDRSGLTTGLDTPAELPPISRESELAIFRAVQEALSNVARHAEAESVTVHLSLMNGSLHLRIRDDGRGLAPGTSINQWEREGHMGLAGMRERITALGGHVIITSESGTGTRLDITVPVTVEAIP
ncbi:MAG: ATP-binding protein [Gemmatimonadales bacterium]